MTDRNTRLKRIHETALALHMRAYSEIGTSANQRLDGDADDDMATMLVALGDALGVVVITQSEHIEHDNHAAFVEDVRDAKPKILNGRRNRPHAHPEDDEDPLMEFAEFSAFQDEAAKLIPKPPKATPRDQAAMAVTHVGVR